ncbi:MAG TPA: hypothetical protein VN132_08030, partial [Bdellovibrio sp.]|nr:hypothetical protein [Bdellovibrio sp.]
MMRYPGYYQESPMRAVEKELSRYNNADQKTTIWNAFVDSELTGVTDDDFSVVPRVLPASYLPTLKRTAYLITKFCMQLLS